MLFTSGRRQRSLASKWGVRPPTPPAIADVLALLAGASRDCLLFLLIYGCRLALRARGRDRHKSWRVSLHELVRFSRGLRVARFPCSSKGMMSAAHESAARLASTHPLFQLSIIVVTLVRSLALRARGRDPCKPSEIVTSPCKDLYKHV